jgi:hypothetical protein
MQGAFDLIEEITDAVQAEPRLEVAKVASRQPERGSRR